MNHRLTSFRYLLDLYGTHEKLINQIHAQATALGLLNHQHFACKILNAYTKLGKPNEAHSVFNQIQNPDIVSWTCLISLYLHTQRPTKAFSLFSDMILCGGLKPDGYSVVGALSACGRNKDLIGGEIVHGMVFRFELGQEPIVGNALIDMYSRNSRINMAQMVFGSMEIKDVASWTSLLNGFIKCKDIESARQVFDKMPQRNIISWTAMIVGYVTGKTPIRGLELFRNLRAESEDNPTAITIVAVLSGCSDVGALDFGRSIHCYINKIGSLIGDVAANNALIDMYSKSGSLDLAMEIFGEMPDKDAFTWTTMISGLALHGKGRYALEVFADMLESKLKPNEITYVSVLSACSHAGLVSEGRKLFNRLISCNGLKLMIEHYGCMVDLLGRAGHLEEAVELIEQMPISPDAVIWRSLLSACLGHGNLKMAEMVGKKILELEPDDDGVYVLLWNIYRSANKWEDALKTRRMMRNQKIKKKPGCSWMELNGIVHEFLAEDTIHHGCTEVYVIFEAITKQSKLDLDLSIFEYT